MSGADNDGISFAKLLSVFGEALTEECTVRNRLEIARAEVKKERGTLQFKKDHTTWQPTINIQERKVKESEAEVLLIQEQAKRCQDTTQEKLNDLSDAWRRMRHAESDSSIKDINARLDHVSAASDLLPRLEEMDELRQRVQDQVLDLSKKFSTLEQDHTSAQTDRRDKEDEQKHAALDLKTTTDKLQQNLKELRTTIDRLSDEAGAKDKVVRDLTIHYVEVKKQLDYLNENPSAPAPTEQHDIRHLEGEIAYIKDAQDSITTDVEACVEDANKATARDTDGKLQAFRAELNTSVTDQLSSLEMKFNARIESLAQKNAQLKSQLTELEKSRPSQYKTLVPAKVRPVEKDVPANALKASPKLDPDTINIKFEKISQDIKALSRNASLLNDRYMQTTTEYVVDSMLVRLRQIYPLDVLRTIKYDLPAYARQIANLEASHSVISKNLGESSSASRENIGKLSDDMKALQANHEQLETRLAAISKGFETLQQQGNETIALAKTQRDAPRDSEAVTNEHFREIESKHQSLQEHMETILRSHGDLIDNLQKRTEPIESPVSGVCSIPESIEKLRQDIEAAAKEHETYMADNRDRLDRLEEKHEAITTSAFDARAIRESIEELRQDMEKGVSDHDVRITANHTRLNSLEERHASAASNNGSQREALGQDGGSMETRMRQHESHTFHSVKRERSTSNNASPQQKSKKQRHQKEEQSTPHQPREIIELDSD